MAATGGGGGVSTLINCINCVTGNTTDSFSNTGIVYGVTTSGGACMNAESNSRAGTNSEGDFGGVGTNLKKVGMYFQFSFTFVMSLYFL